MKNEVLYDIPVEVIKKLDDDTLDILMEWIDDKYDLVHENGRYETANLVESYWYNYASHHYIDQNDGDLSTHENFWLDCAEKIMEYDIKQAGQSLEDPEDLDEQKETDKSKV
jgi:hypothetical protein